MARASNAAVKEVPGASLLTGPQRSAVLVMYLQASAARQLLSHLSTEELAEIARAMTEVDDVDVDVVEAIVGEFVRDLTRSSSVTHTGRDYALGVLPTLLSDHARAAVIDPLRREIDPRFNSLVASRPATTVAALLRDEHPQTRAIAMLLMNTENVSRILSEFGDDERYDLSVRMARLERLPSELVDEVETHVREMLTSPGTAPWAVSGMDRAAQALGRLGRPFQDPVMSRMADEESELSQTIRRRMLVFDDLQGLSDKSIQALLKAVERARLIIALRGGDLAIRERFFKNMSSRASEDLREELELLGPTPRAEIDAAQEEIVQTAVRLAAEGALRLPSSSDDMV